MNVGVWIAKSCFSCIARINGKNNTNLIKQMNVLQFRSKLEQFKLQFTLVHTFDMYWTLEVLYNTQNRSKNKKKKRYLAKIQFWLY